MLDASVEANSEPLVVKGQESHSTQSTRTRREGEMVASCFFLGGVRRLKK